MMMIKSKREACLYTISALMDADLRTKLSGIENPDKYSVKSFEEFKGLLDKNLSPADLTHVTCDFVESAIKGKIEVTCRNLMELAEMTGSFTVV